MHLITWLVALALSVSARPAFGEEVDSQPVVETSTEPEAPVTEEEHWAATAVVSVLAEAVARRRVGDFVGAERRLTHLAQRGEIPDQVVYHQAILAEVLEDYATAVRGYGQVAEMWPDGAVADDARFRQAYCLEDLGQHKAALIAVRRLQRAGKWSERDALTMNLERGIVELRGGKARRGIRRILRGLASAEASGTVPWIRAKARLALVRAMVAEAASIRLVGDGRAAKRLVARSRLIANAQKQAIAMFELGEPEFALEGLLLLGDAYMDLNRDMLDYAPPRSVAPGGHDAYRDLVRKKAAILKVKAHARYDEGVRVAARTRWQGRVTAELKARRDATRPEAAPQGD